MASKTVFVFSGGANKAFFFHYGVLKAYAEDNSLDDIKAVVGSSAGSVMSLTIAGGYTLDDIESVMNGKPTEKTRSIIKPEFGEILKPAVVEFLYTVFRNPGLIIKVPSAITGLFGKSKNLENYINLLYNSSYSLTSICKGEKLNKFIKERFPTNSFSDLKKDLYVIGTDLDSGKRTIFNKSISRETEEDVFINNASLDDAIRASTALAPVFKPYEINGRHYVDGEVARVLSADIGIKVSSRYDNKVIVSYTHQPLHRKKGSIKEYGILNITKQEIYIALHNKIKQKQKEYKRVYRKKEIIWIHPDPSDEKFFTAFEFSFDPKTIDIFVKAGERAYRKAIRG